MSRNNEYLKRGQGRLSGLTQLLSKRPDQFAPGVWPTYFSRAAGTEIWDLDGRRFIDMSISGVGANVLGYCDPEVDQAVLNAIKNGNSSSLNCPEEVELAELLCEIHPWADKVRYARTGGEAMAVAVRIARAQTGRDKIAFCGYHGWHDWYLAANLGGSDSLNGHLLPGLSAAGVPKGLQGSAIPFEYNNVEQLEAILSRLPGQVAAVVMEPIRNIQPDTDFLDSVKRMAANAGAVLVFDEISAGFRLATGGSHLVLGVQPDVAVYAKAISNGYPMAAIVGRAEVMGAVERTFISSTYWTDRIGPAAALASIKKHRDENVSAHLIEIGGDVQEVWRAAAIKSGLNVHVSGIFPMSHFEFDGDNAQMQMTFFVQEMLKHGFLASNRFYANFSHRKEHVEMYSSAVVHVFTQIAELTRSGILESSLDGGVARPGFHRFN